MVEVYNSNDGGGQVNIADKDADGADGSCCGRGEGNRLERDDARNALRNQAHDGHNERKGDI